jgi:hypothetical protein
LKSCAQQISALKQTRAEKESFLAKEETRREQEQQTRRILEEVRREAEKEARAAKEAAEVQARKDEAQRIRDVKEAEAERVREKNAAAIRDTGAQVEAIWWHLCAERDDLRAAQKRIADEARLERLSGVIDMDQRRDQAQTIIDITTVMGIYRNQLRKLHKPQRGCQKWDPNMSGMSDNAVWILHHTDAELFH